MFFMITAVAAAAVTIVIIVIPPITGAGMAIILSMACGIGLILGRLFLQNRHKFLKLTLIQPNST